MLRLQTAPNPLRHVSPGRKEELFNYLQRGLSTSKGHFSHHSSQPSACLPYVKLTHPVYHIMARDSGSNRDPWDQLWHVSS